MTPKETDILEAYRERAMDAWSTFDKLFDAGKDASKAEAEAIHLQQAYFKKYYELNSDECTCKPDSAQACDVCQAQIKSKSQYREEM